MSIQHNEAGNTLVVDEIIEVKRNAKKVIETSMHILDAQLMRRDISGLLDWVDNADNDGIISVVEKQVLYRERADIISVNNIMCTQSEKWNLLDQMIYLSYAEAYNTLISLLDELLSDLSTPSPITEDLSALFGEYYSNLAALDDLIFQYTSGKFDELDARSLISVQIKSTHGVTVPLDGTSVTLSVVTMVDGEDETSTYPDESFNWRRISADGEADDLWNQGEGLSAQKQIEITVDDLIYGTANFVCQFIYDKPDGTHYSQSGIISVSEELPGPQGEDAISLEVNALNGNLFIPKYLSTTLVARVYQGGIDITDNYATDKFRWTRKSDDATADDIWNSAHYSTGGKSIQIEDEDVDKRATFFCELL